MAVAEEIMAVIEDEMAVAEDGMTKRKYLVVPGSLHVGHQMMFTVMPIFELIEDAIVVEVAELPHPELLHRQLKWEAYPEIQLDVASL
jgi:hypothetical protein